jgi:hypothetical protein
MAHTGLTEKRKAYHNQQQQKHSAARHEAGIRAAAAAAKQHMHDPVVKQVVSQLGSAGKDTQHYTAGSLLFGGLLFAAGAATWSLPWLFVLFAVICLPWRAYSFCKQKWVSAVMLSTATHVKIVASWQLAWAGMQGGRQACSWSVCCRVPSNQHHHT